METINKHSVVATDLMELTDRMELMDRMVPMDKMEPTINSETAKDLEINSIHSVKMAIMNFQMDLMLAKEMVSTLLMVFRNSIEPAKV